MALYYHLYTFKIQMNINENRLNSQGLILHVTRYIIFITSNVWQISNVPIHTF